MIKVRINMVFKIVFFLKLPSLSFVFYHDTHFEVSNTFTKGTTQRGAWLVRKERDKLHFYGTVKETLRIVFNRNFLPAPQIRMPAKVLITASCLNNELPVELEMVHPSVMLVAPESVCLL